MTVRSTSCPFDHRGYFQTKMVGCAAPKKATREVAVGEIARRYREFVDIFGTGACRTKV
jgi:hypothetical protein